MLSLNSCIIRQWRWEDRISLPLHANNRNISINLRDTFPWPYTQEDADKFLLTSTVESMSRIAAIEINGEAVGGIGIEPLTDVNRYGGELGYWLAERYWGRGVATEAVSAYSDFIFQNTDLVRLEAHVFSWNTASVKVLEKSNYLFEGIHKKACYKAEKWCDIHIYAKVR